MELEAGQAVGAYIIEALLGRGGMGAVYRAHDGPACPWLLSAARR